MATSNIGGSVTIRPPEWTIGVSYFRPMPPSGGAFYACRVNHSIRSLLAEPRFSPPPPRRVWRDWVLVAAVLIGSLAEALLRDDVRWLPASVAGALLLAAVLPARRTHPFGTAMTMAVAVIALNVATLATGTIGVGLYSMAFVLILPYTLTRWSSGRELGIGFLVMMVMLTTGVFADPGTIGERIGGVVIFLIPFELGAIVRFWLRDRQREIEDVRVREREQLARELHDAVAHHVSAIAIRAQAGQAVAPQSPEAAVEALSVIEHEASTTLAEMRKIVGVLRAEGEPELTPQPGLADVRKLAASPEGKPAVDVTVGDGLHDLGPSVGAAVYRIAQESVTNALRHARNASKVMVRVEGDEDLIRLHVEDDGDPIPARDDDGYGLRGMAERAKLLGGTLSAGPAEGRGWAVDAILPRRVG